MRAASDKTGVRQRLLQLGRRAIVIAGELDTFEADFTDLDKGLGKGDLLLGILRRNPLVEGVELERDLARARELAALGDATGHGRERSAGGDTAEEVSSGKVHGLNCLIV